MGPKNDYFVHKQNIFRRGLDACQLCPSYYTVIDLLNYQMEQDDDNEDDEDPVSVEVSEGSALPDVTVLGALRS